MEWADNTAALDAVGEGDFYVQDFLEVLLGKSLERRNRKAKFVFI